MAVLVGLSGCASVAQRDVSCDCEPFSEETDTPWAESEKMALRLPDARLHYEGPGHFSDVWDTSLGMVYGRFSVLHPREHSTDIHEICAFDVQGYEASVIAYRKWGRYPTLEVWMDETPYGPSLALNMPYGESPEWCCQALAALKSLRFINRMEGLRLVEMGEDEAGPFAVLINEINTVRKARLNDVVSWHPGTFVGVTDDGIVIRWYDDMLNGFVEEVLALEP
jgi:hypothetical protein